MKPSSTITWGKSTDMIAGICRFPRLPCPSTTLHVMLNLTSATSTGVYHTGTSALYVCSLLLWLTTINTTTTYVGVLLLLEKWWKRVVFGCSSSLLHCFSIAAAAAAAVGGAASFCTYSLQNFLFHFPFDEIYRRLIFFTLGRSVSAWIDYSTTKWNRQTRQHQGKRPTW